MDENDKVIRPLAQHDLVDEFISGEPTIDDYFSRFAWSMHQGGGPRTYVAAVGPRVFGYFSLVSGSIEREAAPDRLKMGMGAYPIPIQVLARMGVHQDHQGHGLGGELLVAALLTVARAAELVGVRGVVTHPLNHGLTAFYGRYGFKTFSDPNNEESMYILMKDVRRTLRDTGLGVRANDLRWVPHVSREDLEDLVNEVVARAISAFKADLMTRKWDSTRQRTACLPTYFIGKCASPFVTGWRRMLRQRSRDAQLRKNLTLQLWPAGPVTPERATVDREGVRLVLSCIPDPLERRIAVLDAYDFTDPEIAVRTGVTTKVVEYRLRKLRQGFRATGGEVVYGP